MSNYCVYMLLQIQDHWRKCKNKLVTRLTRRVPLSGAGTAYSSGASEFTLAFVVFVLLNL